MMMAQDTHVTSQYTRIREALDEFNKKKATNLAKLSDAKQKLAGSASALCYHDSCRIITITLMNKGRHMTYSR
jgi:hypothetical protein